MWTMDDGNEVSSRSVVSANNKPSIFTHVVPDINNNNNHSSSKVTTRWSPTAEQLMGLEELYRHGTRTPTALQIQEITAKLRRFGNIEGKNVFYWFQNHKARDKKKQRLKLEAQRRQLYDHNHSKTKPVTQKVTTLHLHSPKPEPLSNCSTISEESGTAVPRATGHSRLVQVDKELKLIKSEEDKHCVSPFKPYMEMPFCFPIINGNNNGITWPNTLISVATTPGLSFFTNIYGNNNIRESDNDIETLDLFPLQSESLSVATDDHQHDYELGAANCDLSLG